MSAKNGGRGTPPVPPEGYGPEPESPVMEVQISKTITQPSKMTTAEKDADGRLHIHFVQLEGGLAVQYTWIVEEAGQENIKAAMDGGIERAALTDIPGAAKAAAAAEGQGKT